jgi:BT1 family
MLAIVSLAYLNMFTSQYKLEPSETQYLSSLIMLPWSPKLVYGILIDTFPIFGSRKRNYLILMSVIMTITSSLVALVKFQEASSVAILLTLMGFSVAVIDGLMVC